MYIKVIVISSLALFCFFSQAVVAQTTSIVTTSTKSTATQTSIGSQLSSDIIQRYQPTINAIAGNGWDHANSVVLHGMQKIYEKNNDPALLNYIRAYVDDYVNADGSVKGMYAALDGMHPGVLCLFMYRQTGDKKYWLAATHMRNYLLGTATQAAAIPRTAEGGYWHKNLEKYRDVMTVDGIYMAYPFLLHYGLLAEDKEAIDTALFQTLLVSEKSFNFDKGLPYHAWDANKKRSWANPATGQSTQFWSRASGWYAMALVDMLEILPATDPRHPHLNRYFNSLTQGLVRWQDHKSGMWYQVLDKVEQPGNYPEMAGTGMAVYALAKGARLGLLSEEADTAAQRAWQAMQTYIQPYKDGGLHVQSVAPGMGCQDNYEAYVAIRPVSIPSAEGKQHTHGYMSVLLAASEMEFGNTAPK